MVVMVVVEANQLSASGLMNRRAGTVYKPFKRWQVRELRAYGREREIEAFGKKDESEESDE